MNVRRAQAARAGPARTARWWSTTASRRLAARGRAQAQPPRPRHVRPAVPRSGEQGLLPQPARAPLPPPPRRGRAGAPWSTQRYQQIARARQGELPARRPARAPQGRPDARAGARAVARAPASSSASPSTAAWASRSRPTPAPLAFLEVDEGPAGVRRHAGRGPRVGRHVLEGDPGKFDYVFTDGMTWTNPAGKRMRLWIPDEVEVGPDEQAFMDLLVSKIVGILENEPIDIYVNPTFLPAVIAAALRRAVDRGADEEGDRRGREERRRDRDQRAATRSRASASCGSRRRRARSSRSAPTTPAPTTSATGPTRSRCSRQLELTWQDMFVPGHQPSRAQRQ